ncbi:hypothetical protein G6F37_007316 [Rhizopus arrhizus]|nr:hypothetical protein G6F38_007478 [Rhizopus arrhizus]KAG1156757.1 hypothetical protein G6F37_007316 [Rhizopus arrhizus]
MSINLNSSRSEQLTNLDGLQATAKVHFAGRRNTSIGPKTNDEMLSGLMNCAFVWKAVNAYLQSSEGGGDAMVWDVFEEELTGSTLGLQMGFEYWPAQSLDLNPIKHVQNALERQNERKRLSVKNLEQSKVALQEEWLYDKASFSAFTKIKIHSLHNLGDFSRHWSMSTQAPGIYIMNKEHSAEELHERLWNRDLVACLNMIHIVHNLCLNGEIPERFQHAGAEKREAQLEEKEDLKRMKNDDFYLEPCNFQYSYRCVTLDVLWYRFACKPILSTSGR